MPDSFKDDDPNAMKRFAVFQAESMEAAIEIAQCAVPENGRTIRVAQIMEMP